MWFLFQRAGSPDAVSVAFAAGEPCGCLTALEPSTAWWRWARTCASGHVEGCAAPGGRAAHRLVAYPALLQRDKFEPVLQKLTELGVAAIVPLITVGARAPARPTTRQTALAGDPARSGRAMRPRHRAALVPASLFEQAMAAAEGTVLHGLRRRAPAHATRCPDASSRVTTSRASSQEVVVAFVSRAGNGDLTARVVHVFVGPEGGFSPDEVTCAQHAART